MVSTGHSGRGADQRPIGSYQHFSITRKQGDRHSMVTENSRAASIKLWAESGPGGIKTSNGH